MSKAVTVYPVIGEPPLAPAVQWTVAAPLPAVATTPVGELGIVDGVAGAETDAVPTPTAFVAETAKV